MSDGEKPAVVVHGNLSEGFEVFGPFPSFNDAASWADKDAHLDFETWVMELQPAVKTLMVSAESCSQANQILSRTSPVEDAGECEVLMTFTAKFGDGYEADVKVCNGDSPYLDPVLFDPDGNEMRCIQDGSDHIEGEYVFDEKHHLLIVCEEEPDGAL